MTDPIDAPRTFATERLLLRRPEMTDAGAIRRCYAADPEAVRYLTWRPHDSEAETLAFLQLCLDKWRRGTDRPYVIERRDDPGAPVGMIEMLSDGRRIDLGYVLARDHWGRGYMPEAMRALIGWCLDQPEIWRVQAVCDIDNAASARAMEKAGMTFEGVLRRYLLAPNVSDEPRDCKLYAAVRPS